MSESKAPTLPPEWGAMLDAVQARLDQALAAADARAAALPDASSGLAGDERAQELAEFSERLHGMAQRLEHAGAVVDAADAALRDGEELLRGHLGAAESLRRRLDEWVGRAIR
jgi:hypothetical protein